MLGGTKTLQAREKRSAVMGKQITHRDSSLLGLGGGDIRRKGGPSAGRLAGKNIHRLLVVLGHTLRWRSHGAARWVGCWPKHLTPLPVGPAFGSSSDWRIQEGLGWEPSRCPQEVCNALCSIYPATQYVLPRCLQNMM